MELSFGSSISFSYLYTIIKTQQTMETTVAVKKAKVCRDCGTIGKPSKGITNVHNVRKSFLRGEVEFETKMVDCIKCPNCGHSWKS